MISSWWGSSWWRRLLMIISLIVHRHIYWRCLSRPILFAMLCLKTNKFPWISGTDNDFVLFNRSTYIKNTDINEYRKNLLYMFFLQSYLIFTCKCKMLFEFIHPTLSCPRGRWGELCSWNCCWSVLLSCKSCWRTIWWERITRWTFSFWLLLFSWSFTTCPRLLGKKSCMSHPKQLQSYI